MWRALSFLTVVGSGTAPDARTMRWFPPVGAAIGLVVGSAWWAADQAFPPLLAAALVVALDLVVTGMLHVDGLADSADGLLPHLPRERRLAVMAEPTVGAFAVVVVVVVLVLRTAAFGSQPPDIALIAGLWCASRSLMVLVAVRLRYARPDGLAAAFLGEGAGVATTLSVLGVAAGAGAATASAGLAGLAASGGLLVGAGAVVALAQRRLGGFTGDVLGALGVVGETTALVVAAAAW